MKRTLPILLLLILALGGGYFYYRQQPAQQINRTVDQLFETVAHKALSLRKPSDTREALEEIFAEEVTLKGLPMLPDQRVPRERLLKTVATLHELTTLCQFEESKRALTLKGETAQALRGTTVIVAWGPETRREQDWELVFTLEKQDRWRITAIRASAR